MEEKPNKKRNLDESCNSPMTPDSGEESNKSDVDQTAGPSTESSPLASSSKSNPVSGAIDDATCQSKSTDFCTEDLEGGSFDFSSTSSSTTSDESGVSEPNYRNKPESQTLVHKEMKNLMKLTKAALRRAAAPRRPRPEVIEDRNANFEEIVVKSSTKLSPASDADHASSKSVKHQNSPSGLASFSGSQPHYKVYDSEDSSSSLEISTNISSLEIAEREKAQKLKISLVESPPKRKHSILPFSSPEGSASVSKKVCNLDEQGMEIAGEGLKDRIDESPSATMGDGDEGTSKSDCASGKPDDIEESDTGNVSEPTIESKDTKTKLPTVQFPEDDVVPVSKSRRRLFKPHLKRTQVMSPDVVEDITDQPTETKRKKE